MRHIIHSWEEVTLAQFIELQTIGKECDGEEYARRVVELLYNVDPDEVPIVEYLSMVSGLRKLTSEKIKEKKLTSNATYTINGVNYVMNINPSSFSMAQYTDFTAFARQEGSVVDMLSAVLVPEGCSYNEGYDMAKAKADIGSLPVANAFGISSFFAVWSKKSIKAILRSLTKQVKKGATTEQRRELQEQMEALSRALEHFLSF